MKTCRHCGETKPLSKFVKHSATKDGYVSTCKSCKKKKYPTTDSQKQKAYERQIKRNYGITVADYDEMFEQQNGVCAGCKQPNNEGRFHIDHCHKTNKVRGLLCGNCNKALGLLKDDVSTLANLILYLNK
jgi:hypothetical protein